MQFTPLEGPLSAEIGGTIGAPRLVFVHGFTQTGRSWRHVVPAFADRFEIVLVDAPGHGGSSHVLADLPMAASLLADTCGRATYIGYSMGGRIVLHLAVSRPELLDALVLVSTTAGIDGHDERIARRASDEALARGLERDGLEIFLERWLALPLFAGLPRSAADPSDRLRNTVDGLASSLRLAGTGTQQPLWARLGVITVPTLVVTGADDVKFTDIGRRLAESVGAHAAHVVVPGSGHSVHLERPDAFVGALRAHVDQHIS